MWDRSLAVLMVERLVFAWVEQLAALKVIPEAEM